MAELTTEMVQGKPWPKPEKNEGLAATGSKAPLPEGLVFHCEECRVVIPSDSPRPEGADCAFVALHKLAPFYPNETVAFQFCGAVAAWELIHDAPLRSGHVESLQYRRQFKQERRSHFDASAARKAMSGEHLELLRTSKLREHMRDRKLGLID